MTERGEKKKLTERGGRCSWFVSGFVLGSGGILAMVVPMAKKQIITFGEALWDCLPEGLFFGGAPVNVAYHLARLGQRVSAVTSVGKDFLGNEALERLENAGVDISWIQRDNEWPTGAVKVTLSDKGKASYEFVAPVAWDRIIVTPALEEHFSSFDALVFGTLAQRSEHNRKTLLGLLERDHWERVYDVNLRPPYDDPALVYELAGKADLLKLNDEEALSLSGLKDGDDLHEAVRELADKTSAGKICVTLGAEGALLWERSTDEFVSEAGREIKIADTVGAGDSFLAALVSGLLEGHSAQAALRQATRMGEFIASKRGAMPDYEVSQIPGFSK